jgi:hypothetical protein
VHSSCFIVYEVLKKNVNGQSSYSKRVVLGICRTSYTYVGFEVLTAVVMKSTIFWDTTPYSSWKLADVSEEYIASIFKVEEWAKQETGMKLCSLSDSHSSLIQRSWRWRRHVPSKRLLIFNGLHGVVSQKTEILLTAVARTPNPTISIRAPMLSLITLSKKKNIFCIDLILPAALWPWGRLSL